MNDLSAHMRTVFRLACVFYAICLLLWAFVPSYQAQAAGLLLGSVVSLVNAQLLMAKINQISKMAAEHTGKRVNIGFVSRAAMSLIAVMISLKFPQFDLICTIIGLFFVQMATLLMGIFSYLKNSKSGKGGM